MQVMWVFTLEKLTAQAADCLKVLMQGGLVAEPFLWQDPEHAWSFAQVTLTISTP